MGARSISFKRVQTNEPSNFLKSECSLNFLCATFYEHSYIFKTTYLKYVQKHFKRKIYVRSKFSCMCSSHDLCAHAHSLERTLVQTQLTGQWLRGIIIICLVSIAYSCGTITSAVILHCVERKESYGASHYVNK